MWVHLRLLSYFNTPECCILDPAKQSFASAERRKKNTVKCVVCADSSQSQETIENYVHWIISDKKKHSGASAECCCVLLMNSLVISLLGSAPLTSIHLHVHLTHERRTIQPVIIQLLSFWAGLYQSRLSSIMSNFLWSWWRLRRAAQRGLLCHAIWMFSLLSVLIMILPKVLSNTAGPTGRSSEQQGDLLVESEPQDSRTDQ